jgi:hypothetical protein
VGAAEFELDGGDRVWWDHRDWTDAMRVPAVVGSYPEPFLHGFQGTEWPVAVGCFAAAASCDQVRGELRDDGVGELENASLGLTNGFARILIGPWPELRSDPAAALLASGPEHSGVFARLDGEALVLLDERGVEASRSATGAGLVAAVRQGEGPPTWIVTGTDDAGVAAAAALFGDGLQDSYAVAVTPKTDRVSVPVEPG